jgi:hypothetical protein
MLTDEQIQEIADELDMGMQCYIHKVSGEIISLPNDDMLHMDESLLEEVLERLENEAEYLIHIESPSSSEMFKIMELFVDQLSDKNPLRHHLYQSLSKSKPFRNFKSVIDAAGNERQQWFDFKNEQLKLWVKEKMKFLI